MRKKITCFTGMMLAVAVLFSATACSFRGEEITISRKLNQSEVFSIDGQSFRVSEMKLLLLNNMNLHGESYGTDLLNNENLKVQKKLEKYLKEYCLEEATRVYSMVALAKSSDIALTDEEQQTIAELDDFDFGDISIYELSVVPNTRQRRWEIKVSVFDPKTKISDSSMFDNQTSIAIYME